MGKLSDLFPHTPECKIQTWRFPISLSVLVQTANLTLSKRSKKDKILREKIYQRYVFFPIKKFAIFRLNSTFFNINNIFPRSIS